MYRNRVHWTRFPCTETEFNELDFHVWKTSSLNSFSLNSAATPSLNSEEKNRKAIKEEFLRERERERETYQLVQKRCRRGVAGRRSGGARWFVISAVPSNAQIVFLSDHVGMANQFLVGMENEFVELVFCTWKSSSLNSGSVHGNRVRWTRFPCFVHTASS